MTTTLIVSKGDRTVATPGVPEAEFGSQEAVGRDNAERRAHCWTEILPCLVTLHSGASLDRVYLVSQGPWIKLWGVYPSSDPGKSEVLVSDLASIADSPSRLPARFATELYKAGESGMGYTVFTVVFDAIVPFLRQRNTYLTGNAVDFIEYPVGKGPNDVASVLPHVGQRSASLAKQERPKYYWCLYSE